MHFTVAFKNQTALLELEPSATLADLGALLASRWEVAPETIKLLGSAGRGLIKLAEGPQRTLHEAGIVAGAKLKMMASSGGDVAAVQRARDLPGLAPLEHELRREAARAAPPQKDSHAPLENSRYTFHHLKPWDRNGLHPPPSEALKLLRRLAADPGVREVMARHRWEVGVLSEMPPEGLVGVSPVCILGVNISKGQEISLRLRTDDLRGFRRYDRILETLVHELAHMVHSEHGAAFKALNSQLLRELSSRPPPRLLTPAGAVFQGHLDYGLRPGGVMEQTSRLSGTTLRQLAAPGEAAGMPAPPSAREAALQAALQRAQVAAGEGAAAAPPQPPLGQQPAGAMPGQQFEKGDLVYYRQQDGEWVPTQVVHVDQSVRPPSYGIAISNAGDGGGGGRYRETEGHRLQPRRVGEMPPPLEVEGLGHHCAETEAKEEEVHRRLEQ